MAEENKNNYCKAHSGIDKRIENVEKDTKEQWTAINQLRNRLPTWATFVISLLTFLLGTTATYAALAVKVASATN